jgi:hypothetical protein
MVIGEECIVKCYEYFSEKYRYNLPVFVRSDFWDRPRHFVGNEII